MNTTPPETPPLFALVMGIAMGLLYSWLWAQEKRASEPGTSNWVVTWNLFRDMLPYMIPGVPRRRDH